MATLQKIRSKGALLILFVGLALFAFIAEEGVRSLSSSRAETHQRIGEVYGKSLNIQEFNDLVDEYVSVVKFTSGTENLTEEQMQQLRDQVWNTYVQNALLEHEAAELGLSVTDAEMQEIIKTGQNPMLAQTPFRNQQTGAFDVEQLNQFLNQYKSIKDQPGQPAEAVEYYTQMYNYWKFIEKTIRQQTLTNKYQSLLSKLFIANPTSVQDLFDARNNEKEALLVSLPFSAVKEEVKADESELKAKYEELKELFRTNQPSRDIKFIDVPVTASKADRDEIIAELQEVAAQMQAENADLANIIRKSGSTISYSALPVRRAALASDIAKEVDSMAVGTQKGPYLNIADNTQNIVRLIAKTTLPDSVQIRQIGIGGMDEAANKKTADSIMTALNAGVPFDSIAKKYNQTGEAQWITSAQYERATLDENNLKFINAINAQAVGTTQQIQLGTGIAIVRVDDRKNMVEKYQVAVVKRPIDFSNDTFNKTYNDFSQFVASNKTPEEIEANAVKAGYMVQQRADVFSTEHNVAGLSGTREAFRWIFNKDTKVGEISEIYTCGNNDHLLVVILTGKNDGKFSTLESESVKAYVEEKVLADKKAGILQEQMEGCADIQAVAKLAGAQTDTIRHITFASPVFVPSVGGSENALAGAVAKTPKGGFTKGVKGNAAVYALQVINETKTDTKLDDAVKQNITAQINGTNFRAASGFMRELYLKANVKDNRYLFY